MKNAWISIAGLITHYPDVLDNFALPAAADIAGPGLSDTPWVPVKQDLINYLCWELAELPLVYSDPVSLKIAVEYWSKSQLKTWTELLKTLNYEYNPLWNKDGEVQETRDITFRNASNSTDTGTVGTSGSSSGSNENQVTGYDTNTYSPNERNLTSGSASETETRNLAGHTYHDGESHDRFGRWERGNIGLTTTMQLIREQRDLVQLNFYEFLTLAFKREFCVMVW